ncbi:radial spoke head 10 homolog B-like isoform X2 [Diadema setosum]|uniref:radial spoke head 10 homolog B-like isoform X2 n=1 Tax=Diadema setosum TaxID=31175 RepID=UPI003B3BDD6D
MASKKGGKKGSKKAEKVVEEPPPPAEEKKDEAAEENQDDKQQEAAPAEDAEPVKEPTPPPEHDEPTLAELIVEHYEGDKTRGLYDNDGVAYFSGGHCYKGQFSHGLMHGKGTYLWTDGVKYEGDFNMNEITGKGTYTWPDGSMYEGEVLKGRRHGHGTFRCMSSPSSYTGQWQQGLRHGTGIIRYDTDGLSFYEGDWVNNNRHGYGVRRYRSGNVYEGEWAENNRHGQGMMRWVDLNQSYSGQWDKGVQHGHGEHTWYLKRLPGSQYPLRNQYIGDFVYGKRHGYGVFLYANGAKYEGEWMHDKKSGRGVFTFKNGRIFDGIFVEDRMAEYPQFTIDGNTTPDISGIRTRTPDPAGPAPDLGDLTARTDESRNTLGPSLTLDLQHLLQDFSEEEKEEELQQVMFVILRHMTALKKVYSYYSGLGHDASPDNTFIMTRLQFWRFLKDCRFHHLDATLAEMDRILASDKAATDIHSPLDKLLMREFLNHLITLAYHLYRDQHQSGCGPMLAWCLSRTITENIVPFACDVQGNFLFDERHAVNALGYMDRCYEVYQAICSQNKYPPYEQTLKMRDFLHTMNDYGLVNDNLTAKRILEILSCDDPAAYDSHDCNLELEMTFLDFFEAVIGCAMYFVTEEVIKDPATPRPSTVISHHTHTSYSSTTHPSTSRTSHPNDDVDDPVNTGPGSPRTSNFGSPGPRAMSSSEVARKASEAKVEKTGSIVATLSLHTEIVPEGSTTVGEPMKPSKSEAGTEAKVTSTFSLVAGDAGLPVDGATETQTHLLQSVLSMGAEEAQQQEEEAVEEMEEEMSEDTRRFNFWTHQINIFLLRKLFPAHEHMKDVQAKRAVVREERQLAHLRAEREREEREKRVQAQREADRLSEEAKAREMAAAASEAGGGNETIEGSVSEVRVERSKSNISVKK